MCSESYENPREMGSDNVRSEAAARTGGRGVSAIGSKLGSSRVERWPSGRRCRAGVHSVLIGAEHSNYEQARIARSDRFRRFPLVHRRALFPPSSLLTPACVADAPRHPAADSQASRADLGMTRRSER